MISFQVLSKTEKVSSPPKKRRRRVSQEWHTVYRVVRSMGISALLFVLILDLSGTTYAFVLLPVFLSLFIANSRNYKLWLVLDGTPLYLLLTFCFALVYYTFITAMILLLHFDPHTARIILVTTTLAWAVMLEPARSYIQSHIERRFNVRNHEASKAVEAFTSTLREEINLDQLRERFLSVVQQALQPCSVLLWTRIVELQEGKTGATGRLELAVAGDEPLIAYLLHHPGVTEIDRLQLDSPLLEDLQSQAVDIVLPLASQGELIGLLLLGVRLNGEEYSREDRSLLNTLAPQVAPALRVAQMVQQQQAEILERERIEQELRTAQAIQQAFLPGELPVLPGWQFVTYYQPAREVGGDFYDFLTFEDGRIGIIIGDVTGKGIPAALVMATVHTMLRTAVQGMTSPGAVLARVNDLLSAEIPAGMFVTCFFALLDPGDGHICYANAGHDLPCRYRRGEVDELYATGMPLGLMPEMQYEEHEVALDSDEYILFYSDGLVEAHNSRREMFGFPRLKTLLAKHTADIPIIDFLLSELSHFTGSKWVQEDDVTLLALQRISES